MTDQSLYINGLAATQVRLKLTEAIADEPGRIYYETAAKACYDAVTGRKCTASVEEQIRADWIRARRQDEPLHYKEWSTVRVYYRLTDYGRAAIERGRR